MREQKIIQSKNATLADAIDRLLQKGAYVGGDLLLGISDIELVYVGLRLIITSVSAEEKRRGRRLIKKAGNEKKDKDYIRVMEEKVREIEKNIGRLAVNPQSEDAEKGLGKLVLTIVELLRQLMEREAMRRIEAGALTRKEIEKIGVTFRALEKKIEELKLLFGIKEDLNLDLGPLGRLL